MTATRATIQSSYQMCWIPSASASSTNLEDSSFFCILASITFAATAAASETPPWIGTIDRVQQTKSHKSRWVLMPGEGNLYAYLASKLLRRNMHGSHRNASPCKNARQSIHRWIRCQAISYMNQPYNCSHSGWDDPLDGADGITAGEAPPTGNSAGLSQLVAFVMWLA